MKRKHIRHGRRPGTSYKALGLAAAAGVAAIVGAGFLAARVQVIKDHWYAAPLLAVGGGVILAKKMPTIALGLVAAGAVIGYIGYQASKSSSSTSPSQAAAGFDAGYHQGRRMSVRGDSGLFERTGNAGALLGAGARAVARGEAGALLGAGAPAIARSQSGAMGDAGSLGLD